MGSRSKKVSKKICSSNIPLDAKHVHLIQKSQTIFSSSNIDEIQLLSEELLDLLIVSSQTDPPNTSLRRSVVKSFSNLSSNYYPTIVERSLTNLNEFFHRNVEKHRTEILSLLNYLIENFPFGLTCVIQLKQIISKQLIKIGEDLWKDIRLTNVPHQRFQYFQILQYYLKVVVYLLPKFAEDLEKDQIIVDIVRQILLDQEIVPLDIRLTASLVWHSFRENLQLTIDERYDRMKELTNVKLSQLSLYFALIKTMINEEEKHPKLFQKLLKDILSFQTREATVIVAIAKALETYSDALKSTSNQLSSEDLNDLIDCLLTFSWDHFSYNVETVRHCSTNIYSNTLKVSMSNDELRPSIIAKQLKLLKDFPWQKDGSSIVYHCLLEYLRVKELIELHPQLISSCLLAMNDRGLASEASHLFCVLCQKHFDEENNWKVWKQHWFEPVIDALDHSNALHRSLIAEYILPKLLRNHGDVFQELKQMTKKNRTLIVCTRIGRSLGLCPTLFSSNSLISTSLIDEQCLRQGLTSADEQISLDCLFILCENPKTTEVISEIEFDLLKYFLQLNIDHGSTSFRNQILSLIKKHFIRMKESWLFCARQKTKNSQFDLDSITDRYRIYLKWLINWSCSHLYLEGTYSQRHLSILILHWLIHLHGKDKIEKDQNEFYHFEEFIDEKSVEYLFNCFWDTYEDIRQYALEILLQLNFLTKNRDELRLEKFFDRILQLLSSSQPPETASGATLVQCLAQISLPQLHQIRYFQDKFNNENQDQLYLLIDQIRFRLDKEVQQAKENLFQAAKNGPMYGCLSGINALLNIFNGDQYQHQSDLNKWRKLFSHFIDLSLEIAQITGPIVSSSSPEGMMPMELTDLREKTGEDSIEGEVTSQMLLVCCWRTIKEISFLFSRLGEISIKFIRNSSDYRFINLQQIHSICQYFMEQLLKSRHCGAYELAYTGFVNICHQLWNSNCDDLCHLPIQWINEGISMVEENTLDRNKLCLTRRSGGLPFYLQSILTDEPIQQRAQQRTYVNKLMTTLLDIIENDPDTFHLDGQSIENSRKIHAFNTVRSFYRNQRFANDVLCHIERGLHLSIIGFTSTNWMIRNSSTLLLSTIVQRIFGPSKTKDGEENLSKKNSMTSREFFNKYPSLFHLFYQQLKETTSSRPSIESLSSSSLFAILLILRRLYPSPLDGIDCSLTLEKLFPFVLNCEQSPLLRIREHSSKALLAFIHHDQYSQVISQRIQLTIEQSKENQRLRQNILHGRLLQINGIFHSMKKHHLQLILSPTFSIEEMISTLNWCIYDNDCPLTRSSYLEMLFHLDQQINSNSLKIHLNEYLNYLLTKRTNDIITIGIEDLTKQMTHLIIHLNNSSILPKMFIFIEQHRTELRFVETFLISNRFDAFQDQLHRWINDLLLTIDLFNEELFTKSCELLTKLIDRSTNYHRLAKRLVELIDEMRRPMSIAASLNLLSELIPLSYRSSNEEDFIKNLSQRIEEFLDDDLNDECACALLHLLCQTKDIFLHSSIERKCQYWKFILKISSISSDPIREKFTKIIPIIIDDQRLTGEFGANPYVTQDILFEYLRVDALKCSSSTSLFLHLIGDLFEDLLKDIHSDDSNEADEAGKLSLDRRLWPSSEGYNNVFVSETETCDYYSARYGQNLLILFETLWNDSSKIHFQSIIDKLVRQTNELIDIQHQAHREFYVRQRSTVRLNFLIKFLRITNSSDRIDTNKIPRLWISNFV